MPRVRVDVPDRVADALIAANHHTCCICREPRLPIEIHHIDSDPSNNRPTNLAVLCRNCHGLVSQRSPLGRSYKPGEVRRYKQEWEAECESDEPDGEVPVHQVRKTILVKVGMHAIEHLDDVEVGDVVVATISSEEPVSVYVAPLSEYRRFLRGDEDAEFLEFDEQVFDTSLVEDVAAHEDHVFWIAAVDADAKVTFDLALWRPELVDDDEDE